jgi:hypothetical protein
MQFPSDVAVRVIDALLADEPPNRLIAAAPEEAAATSLDEGRRQVASPTGS